MVMGGSPRCCIARTGVKVAERLGGLLPSSPRAQQAVGPPHKGGIKTLLGCSGGQLSWGRAPGGAPTLHRGTAWGFFEMGTFPSSDFPRPNYGNFLIR